MNIIHVLWTGGLDSTARIVYLTRLNVEIQPYYVIDDGRASTPKEMEAMRLITDRLRNDSNTKARLNDIIFIRESDIKPDYQISNAWKRLYEKYRVGSQYDWLARYAKQKGITLEIGIEKGDGRAQTSIYAESNMVAYNTLDGSESNYRLDRNLNSGDVWTLFHNFSFPLWETNKQAEISMMKKLGCGDIVPMTWFCHAPLFGKPCGHCNPCKDAYHYNLGWRISRVNYYLWFIFRPKTALKQFYNRIINR